MRELTGIGLFEHYNEIKAVEKMFNLREGEEDDDDDDEREIRGFNFSFVLRKGDRFPKVKGVTAPFKKKINVLEHNPGEILVIVTSQRWNRQL